MTAGLVADTTPYPWPYDGALAAERCALVVAGHDAGWAGRAADAAAIADVLDDLARSVAAAGVRVVRVVHRPDGVEPGPPPGTLADGLDVAVVRAAGVDAFFGSDLDHLLRATGRDLLLLAGFGLEAPVHSTMRSANDRGYECLLLLDACAALDPDLLDASRSMVEMSGGIFGAVGSVAAALDALTSPPDPHPDPSEGSP